MPRFLSILANPTSAKAVKHADSLESALASEGWTVNRTGRSPGESAEVVAERVEQVVGVDEDVLEVFQLRRLRRCS